VSLASRPHGFWTNGDKVAVITISAGDGAWFRRMKVKERSLLGVDGGKTGERCCLPSEGSKGFAISGSEC